MEPQCQNSGGSHAHHIISNRSISNYTFFSWEVFDGGEFRAAFILTGEVTATETKNGEGKLYLHLVREGTGNYQDKEEVKANNFDMYPKEMMCWVCDDCYNKIMNSIV